MKGTEAYYKIDHTLCLNQCEQNLKFNIDNDDHIDCIDVKEMVQCLDIIQLELKAFEILKDKYIGIRFNDEKMFIEFTDLEKHYTYLYFSKDEKEQYDLLKEVLKNEKDE